MAVDTRQKRMSMLNFAEGSTTHVLFEADGTVDLDDMQHLLDCYSGIAFNSTVVGVPIGDPITTMVHDGRNKVTMDHDGRNKVTTKGVA